MRSSIRIFGWSITLTVAALVGSLIGFGVDATLVVLMLIVLEVSLSFDNAVVNAGVLQRMNEFWQKLFLTVGMLIAVFGMRLIFPLLLVAVTAHISPAETARLALQGGTGPGSYADHVHEAHPAIAGFGGMFLLMLFLDWVFTDRRLRWLRPLETPLARLGRLDQLSVVVALVSLVLSATFLATGSHGFTVLVSGCLGIVSYLVVNGLGELFESHHDDDEQGGGSGRAGLFLFLYLEVLDASFSFDGVVGAFAITQDVFVIAIGLGVGAFWIRSLTIYLVHQGTLDDYVYLEHGAHWAIGALAAILLLTIRFEINEIVTGLIGVTFITLSMISSVVRNRRLEREPGPRVEAS